MKMLRLENLSERQQVLAIILVASLAIFLLWFFLLLPQSRARRNLAREIAGMRQQLQQRNFLMGEPALRQEKDQEQKAGDGFTDEWGKTTARLAAFDDQQSKEGGSFGKIDYKVALFEVRSRLMRKSREGHAVLPQGLSLSEEVGSEEDARVRMLQLRAVERLVDLALDGKISQVQQIKPLPVIEHKLEPTGPAYLEEYPVRLECYGTMEKVHDILNGILRSGRVFALRNLRVEVPEAAVEGDSLRMQATVSSLVFVKGPDELIGPLPKAAVRRGPAGY